MEVRQHVVPSALIIIGAFVVTTVATFYTALPAGSDFGSTFSSSNRALTTSSIHVKPLRNGLAEVSFRPSDSTQTNVNSGSKLGKQLSSTSLNLLSAQSVLDQPQP